MSLGINSNNFGVNRQCLRAFNRAHMELGSKIGRVLLSFQTLDNLFLRAQTICSNLYNVDEFRVVAFELEEEMIDAITQLAERYLALRREYTRRDPFTGNFIYRAYYNANKECFDTLRARHDYYLEQANRYYQLLVNAVGSGITEEDLLLCNEITQEGALELRIE
jgi:hypothetical protein